MYLEVLKHRETVTDDSFSGLNNINKRRRDAFRGYKILSKIYRIYLQFELQLIHLESKITQNWYK